MMPGQMALTRMPSAATSCAMHAVSAWMPAFDAA